ncbi:cobalt-precorrin-5B (C(1))-methyltransferase [Methanorbis rubei]|uniref:Cobalt-precorrin-5B C(1)-methyltransferase n=1 Tax=Methanorbis rubei TaxID=3028300 RepID=A0AAE4MHJ3_9EURY|nr:Cobalt-precorrin-5B C(1)-methyltransferase [Methanocorpusculaceae archaeon Cs1]
MIDPVSGFPYPEAWVAQCDEPAALELAESGVGVLTANGTVLRRGFTTGTTAAAAAFAAVASLHGEDIAEAEITLPCNIMANVPAKGRNGRGEARKFAGDYPDDITAGILICAEAKPADATTLIAGEGIGRFSRATPRYAEGEPAISPQARDEILSAIESACRAAGIAAAEVLLTIPDGRRIGALTLNPKVGVLDGISVVGTTGFVEPWDDHLTETLAERISAAKDVVITTGRTGLRFSRLLFPDYEVVLAGSKISEALAAAASCRNVVICGLPGLILRFFHPETATSRGFATVEELMASQQGPAALAAEVADAKRRYSNLRIVIIDRSGAVLIDSEEES